MAVAGLVLSGTNGGCNAFQEAASGATVATRNGCTGDRAESGPGAAVRPEPEAWHEPTSGPAECGLSTASVGVMAASCCAFCCTC